MEPTSQFHQIVSEILSRLAREEGANIAGAGRFLAGVIAGDHLVFVFGTGGHSYIAAEEMSFRAGGLGAVYPVLDPGVSIAFGSRRSSAVERTPGYAQAVLGTYPITKDDALVIVNAYGINSCTIDTALWARDRSIKTIGVTSPAFANAIPKGHPARHPSGKNLHELVDIVLDNKMPERDAVLQFPGLQAWTSPVSTIVNAFVIQALVGETTQALLGLGQTPPIWTSANIPGGDEANKGIVTRYGGRVRGL